MNFLYNERKDAHLTQVQMAKKLGIAQSTLSKLEHGKLNPTLHVFARYCRALELEPHAMLDGLKYKWRR